MGILLWGSVAATGAHSVFVTNISVDVFIITLSRFTLGRRFVKVLRSAMVSDSTGMQKKLEKAQIQQKYRSKHLIKSKEIMQILAKSYNFDICFCLISNC